MPLCRIVESLAQSNHDQFNIIPKFLIGIILNKCIDHAELICRRKITRNMSWHISLTTWQISPFSEKCSSKLISVCLYNLNEKNAINNKLPISKLRENRMIFDNVGAQNYQQTYCTFVKNFQLLLIWIK